MTLVERQRGQPEQRFKVLVADPSEVSVEMLRFHLDKLAFDVVDAATGIDALEKAAQVFPDLILLDVGLPEVDGFEVCKTLKENYLFDRIPVILMSDGSDPELLLKGLSAGGEDYLVRPFVPEDLEQRLTMHLARSREFVTVVGLSLKKGLAYAASSRMRMLEEGPASAGRLLFRQIACPSPELGGDVAGFTPLDPDHAVLFSVSVDHVGIAPTLLTASIHALFDPHTARGLLCRREGGREVPRDPDDVLDIIERAFPTRKTGLKFRICCMLLEQRTGEFSYAARGLPQILHARPGGTEDLGTSADVTGALAVGSGHIADGEMLAVIGPALYSLPTMDGKAFGIEPVRDAITEAMSAVPGDALDAAVAGVRSAIEDRLGERPPAVDGAVALVQFAGE